MNFESSAFAGPKVPSYASIDYSSMRLCVHYEDGSEAEYSVEGYLGSMTALDCPGVINFIGADDTINPRFVYYKYSYTEAEVTTAPFGDFAP